MARKKKPTKSVLSVAQEIATKEVSRLLIKSKSEPLNLEDARLLEIYTKLIISKRESSMKLQKDQLSRVSAMTDEELKDYIKHAIGTTNG